MGPCPHEILSFVPPVGWAGQVGDRSLLWGTLAKGGPRKVAGRLVDSIKDSLLPGTATLPAPPALSDEERAALSELSNDVRGRIDVWGRI